MICINFRRSFLLGFQTFEIWVFTRFRDSANNVINLKEIQKAIDASKTDNQPSTSRDPKVTQVVSMTKCTEERARAALGTDSIAKFWKKNFENFFSKKKLCRIPFRKPSLTMTRMRRRWVYWRRKWNNWTKVKHVFFSRN